MKTYEERVQELIREGMSNSDAQSIADMEEMQCKNRLKESVEPLEKFNFSDYEITAVMGGVVNAWSSKHYKSYEDALRNGAVYWSSNTSYGYTSIMDRIEGWRDAVEACGDPNGLMLRVVVSMESGEERIFEGPAL